MTDAGRHAVPDLAIAAEELVAVTGGTLVRAGSRPARGGAVDSRLVEPGNLFVALPGERTDGHRFLAAAAAAGATAFLVTRDPDPAAGEAPFEALGDVTIVRVADPLAARVHPPELAVVAEPREVAEQRVPVGALAVGGADDGDRAGSEQAGETVRRHPGDS